MTNFCLEASFLMMNMYTKWCKLLEYGINWLIENHVVSFNRSIWKLTCQICTLGCFEETLLKTWNIHLSSEMWSWTKTCIIFIFRMSRGRFNWCISISHNLLVNGLPICSNDTTHWPTGTHTQRATGFEFIGKTLK